jgi:hypothetical protein
MITHPNDSSVICDDCHQTAVQREVDVRVGTDTRRIVYQTHHVDLSDDSHHRASKRIRNFHAKVATLREALREIPEADRELEYGILTEFDIATVKPSACNVRTDIKPSATVRFHHKATDVGLPPRPLKGQTVARLLREFRVAAGPVVTRLKEQFDRGR